MLKPKQKNKSINYEDLGRIIASVYETGYANRGRMYRMSFVKGLFGGLGGVVGATIVVGLLAWLLSFFDVIPFVEDLRETIEQGR